MMGKLLLALSEIAGITVFAGILAYGLRMAYEAERKNAELKKTMQIGHWSYVPVKPMKGLQDGWTYCSVCGRPEKAWNKDRKFCSYCGAYLEKLQ